MAVPQFEALMLPLLHVHADGQPYPRRELRERLSAVLGLSEEDLGERLPSGVQGTFENRTNWAAFYLTQAGLLERAGRGVTKLTPRGEAVLGEAPAGIDIEFLKRFSGFQEFLARKGTRRPQRVGGAGSHGEVTPLEAIEGAYQEIRSALVEQVLERLRTESPAFFEQVVLDVLLAMGYGGSRREAGEQLGRSGDGGVDGVIREDRLGLDVIYLQAKRWAEDHAVRRPDVQAFTGALQGFHADKGVFITTSRFTDDARTYAAGIQTRVVLIDGAELAELMIDHGVGVSIARSYDLKRLDEDYFDADLAEA
jgi:restriction system protein